MHVRERFDICGYSRSLNLFRVRIKSDSGTEYFIKARDCDCVKHVCMQSDHGTLSALS